MEKYEVYLIKAMECAIKDIPLPPPQEKIDMALFYKKAVEHKLENLIFKGVNENIDWFYNSDEIFKKWKQLVIFSSISLIKLDAIVNSILDKFEDEKIDALILKGAVIKKLYPKMELRTMGDTDMIVKEEDYPKVKEIFEGFSYYEEMDAHGNPQFKKENNYKFEVFFSLKTIDKVWEIVENIEGRNYIYKLECVQGDNEKNLTFLEKVIDSLI